MYRHWARLAVVALAAACWAAVSGAYVFGEGASAASANVLRVAPQGADYKSIQAAVNAAEPGAEIVVENGTYTESIWIAKARLTLRSARKHGAKIVAPPKRDAIGLGEGANYITIDGFDITAPGGNGIQTNRNGIKHVFNHHTIVRNCYIHDCGGGGIQLNHGDYRTVEYNLVHHCATTGRFGQSGISLWQAIALDREPGFHIIVRGNILWNNSNPPKDTDGNGLIIDDFRNTQYGSTNGVYPNKTLVENNVAYHNGARGIHVFLSDHVVLRNNTAYHNNWDKTNDATWRGELSCINSSDVKWYNNIAVASSAMNGNNTAMMDGGGNQNTEWAGNLFFDSDKPATPSVKLSGGADRKAVLANNLFGADPKFVAPGTGADADFRLKAGSPAIGTAVAANSPTTDVLGRKRDDKPDIGAYEFVASLATTAVPTTAMAADVPIKVPLWPGKAPVGDGTYETVASELKVYLPSPDKATGAAVVICPGGGYIRHVVDREGYPIADWLNAHGIAAILLEYRLPEGRTYVPLLDAQRAIRITRAKAGEWKIDPQRVGVLGFSAGGHVASTVGTHFDAGRADDADLVERLSCRPDFMLLVYPVVTMGEKTHELSKTKLLGANPKPELVRLFSNETQVTDQTPPAFLVHAKDDTSVPPDNSRNFVEAMKAHRVPVEYLELPSGGHGLNGCKGPLWEEWKTKSLAWLASRGFLPSKVP